MKRLFKLNRKVYITLGIVILTGLGFYWYQIRPAKIKHDCSWVEAHSDATPAIPATTKEEAEKIRAQCPTNNQECFSAEFLIHDYEPAQPAKNWWKQATPQQYQFCLHDKGL